MCVRKVAKPLLTCFTRFRSLAFRRETDGVCIFLTLKISKIVNQNLFHTPWIMKFKKEIISLTYLWWCFLNRISALFSSVESGKIWAGFKLKLALLEGCKIPTLTGEVGNLNTLILDWKLSKESWRDTYTAATGFSRAMLELLLESPRDACSPGSHIALHTLLYVLLAHALCTRAVGCSQIQIFPDFSNESSAIIWHSKSHHSFIKISLFQIVSIAGRL